MSKKISAKKVDERDLIATELSKSLLKLDKMGIESDFVAYILMGVCGAIIRESLGEEKLIEILDEIKVISCKKLRSKK